jgi:serpin B
LTTNGANGQSQEEMLLALENKDLEELNEINLEILKVSKDFSTIEIANAIMTAFTPKEKFVDIALQYESSIEPLKSVTQVNNWCNLKTHGKIPKIMDQLPPNTVMVLLNALYFKGEWVKEFSENLTTTRAFYNFNDESKSTQIPMMLAKDNYNYYEDSQQQIIEIPYKKDYMSAVIILPSQSIDINKYISKLDDDTIQKLIKKMSTKEVQLQLPKFELEFDSTLNEILQKMGMVQVFDQSLADLTGMKDEKDIYIGQVLQKTYLKVDEKGSEAAAVTAVVVQTKSMPLNNNRMIINRPFLFMLRNKKLPQNYEMLFMAKIEQLGNK